MIGAFKFGGTGDPRAIRVELIWSENQRKARLQLPEHVALALELSDLIAPEETLSVASALSYAVFIGMRCETRLVVCGDRSVWNEAWGRLDQLH